MDPETGRPLRVAINDPKKARLYACGWRPIFVAVHPQSKAVYASLDQSSAILCITPGAREPMETIAVPADAGSTPVGLIPGVAGFRRRYRWPWVKSQSPNGPGA